MGDPADKPTRQRIQSGLYVKAAPGLRLVDRQATRLISRMRRAMPWLQPSDLPAVRGWARLEVLVTQAYSLLRAQSVVDPHTAEPRRLLKDVRQLLQAQLSYETALGMTPASRLALKTADIGTVLDLESFRTDDSAQGAILSAPTAPAPQDTSESENQK